MNAAVSVLLKYFPDEYFQQVTCNILKQKAHSISNSTIEFGKENMGTTSANANTQCPPWLLGQSLTGFWLRLGE